MTCVPLLSTRRGTYMMPPAAPQNRSATVWPTPQTRQRRRRVTRPDISQVQMTTRCR
jgi:hypothetical protein